MFSTHRFVNVFFLIFFFFSIAVVCTHCRVQKSFTEAPAMSIEETQRQKFMPEVQKKYEEISESARNFFSTVDGKLQLYLSEETQKSLDSIQDEIQNQQTASNEQLSGEWNNETMELGEMFGEQAETEGKRCSPRGCKLF